MGAEGWWRMRAPVEAEAAGGEVIRKAAPGSLHDHLSAQTHLVCHVVGTCHDVLNAEEVGHGVMHVPADASRCHCCSRLRGAGLANITLGHSSEPGLVHLHWAMLVTVGTPPPPPHPWVQLGQD